LHFDPFNQAFVLSDRNVDVNYILQCEKSWQHTIYSVQLYVSALYIAYLYKLNIRNKLF
jgi:hypothetical protein